jgi:hypothetical protein
LSEIQTWIALREKRDDVPPLELWLARAQVGGPAADPAGHAGVMGNDAKIRPPVPVDPLEAAEGSVGRLEPGVAVESPMEAFSAARKARRDRILREAQAGMEQVTAERQIAEEEYAAKKLAAAQAEAAAMKHQAEQLAAVEKEALDQRQYQWSTRLKKLVGNTAGAFGGAFLGGMGARAAEEAIDSVWSDY